MYDFLISEIMNQNLNLFYYINSGINNSFLDITMPFISIFGSFYAWTLFCFLLLIFGGKKAKKVVILGLTALFLAKFVVEILKSGVAEPRPSVTLSNVNLLVSPNNSYAFPSSHAASSFAIATIIGLKYNFNLGDNKYRLIYPLMVFAAIISFSRIYVGEHYPLDVLCGAIIGVASAMIVLKYEKLLTTWIKTIWKKYYR